MKIRILSIYNKAKTEAKPLLFSASLSSLIPKIYDEEGHEIDTDFVSYYLNNYNYYDNYIKYNHGKKLYYYDDEEFGSSLDAFQDEAASIMAIHAPAWASEYAANIKKNKIILDNIINKIDTLGDVEEIRTMGAQHSETLFGEDETTANYGALSTTMTTGARSASNNHSEKTFEANSLAVISSDSSTNQAASDTSATAAHVDSSVREARTDTTDTRSYVDRIEKPETINEYITKDNSGYFEKLNNIPEFSNLMRKIINTIIIETGAKYDY